MITGLLACAVALSRGRRHTFFLYFSHWALVAQWAYLLIGTSCTFFFKNTGLEVMSPSCVAFAASWSLAFDLNHSAGFVHRVLLAVVTHLAGTPKLYSRRALEVALDEEAR